MLYRVLLLFLLTSCFAARPPIYAAHIVGHEYRTSVRIFVGCLTGPTIGSGVVISPNRVLTARHVIDCDGKAPLMITVFDYERVIHLMKIDKLAHDGVDAARLIAVEEKPFRVWAHVTTTPHNIGETVCAVTGDTQVFLVRKCGELSLPDPLGLMHTIQIVPGNSGSALWDLYGDVIGINVRGRWDYDKEKVGVAVPASNFEELLDITTE